MTIKEAMQKAVSDGNAVLAGRICDKMRHELGVNYEQVEARFMLNTGCRKEDFENLMYWADTQEAATLTPKTDQDAS